jgi:hypothetical protein
MRLRLDLDDDATQRLVAEAALERRPVSWQAEVLLRRALGLPDRAEVLPAPESRQPGREAPCA